MATLEQERLNDANRLGEGTLYGKSPYQQLALVVRAKTDFELFLEYYGDAVTDMHPGEIREIQRLWATGDFVELGMNLGRRITDYFNRCDGVES